ncbi:hypothetical protein A2U01_0074172, partial [Trifolium medium]|nr:hypothetical protein [Trifolium medium]
MKQGDEDKNEEHAAESEGRPERQGPIVEITTVLPEEQTQVVVEGRVSKEIVEDVIPLAAGLAMTDKDTTTGE